MTDPQSGEWDEKKDSANRHGDEPDADVRASREQEFQLRQDTEHIKILSIIWYVISGLFALSMCGGILYGVIGGLVTANGRSSGPEGIVFLCLGIFLFVFSLTAALLSFLTARNLPKRQGHMLCLVASGLVCLWIPFGTLLGVFTIMVLLRPTVKQSFGVE